MRKVLKLFYPGLGLKRWALLFVLALVMVLAASLVLIMGVSGFRDAAGGFVHGLMAMAGRPIYWVLLLVFGLALMIWSSMRFSRSLLVLAPNSEKTVDMLYHARKLRRGPRLVVIGGGTGLSTLLRGLKHFTSNITAVVAVTDDGGSSGILRGQLGMPPPGDIRNCLVALADTEPLLESLFQHRFQTGDSLGGHSFGNLFLAAMTEMLGFQQAVQESGKVLAVRGKVLPVTAANVSLRALCADGSEIWGESNIGKSAASIQQLEIVPQDSEAIPEVIEAIAGADAIIVGPGSLYTSLLPNLLVNNVVDAIAASAAPKFYVCNIMTEAGETQSFSAADHVETLYQHISKEIFDYVVVNNQPVPDNMLQRYIDEGAQQVKVDWQRLRNLGVNVLAANLLQPGHVAWHNPHKLARTLLTPIVEEHLSIGPLDSLLLEFHLKRERQR